MMWLCCILGKVGLSLEQGPLVANRPGSPTAPLSTRARWRRRCVQRARALRIQQTSFSLGSPRAANRKAARLQGLHWKQDERSTESATCPALRRLSSTSGKSSESVRTAERRCATFDFKKIGPAASPTRHAKARRAHGVTILQSPPRPLRLGPVSRYRRPAAPEPGIRRPRMVGEATALVQAITSRMRRWANSPGKVQSRSWR